MSPLPVPKPVLVLPNQGCLVYSKLPGVPLLDLPSEWRMKGAVPFGAMLGELLAALHPMSVERLGIEVGADDQPLAQWRQETARPARQ